MEILLSIVVPVYNAEAYLYKNIMTLIKQKKVHDNFEIILVNDGSTDESESICFELKKEYKNIKYFYQENKGVSEARNKGIQLAEGKYICFLDSDDYVGDNYVETVLANIENNDLVIFDNYIVNDNCTYKEKKWLSSKFNSLIEKKEAIELMCENKLNAPWDKIYKKEIIDKNNLKFKVGLNLGEDLLFNLDYVVLCKKILVSNESIYYHTLNENSLSHKKTTLNKYKDFSTMYDEMIKRINVYKHDEVYIEKTNIAFLRIIANYSGKLYKSGVEKKKIQKHFLESKMFNNIINVKVNNCRDYIRKFLLKNSMYNLCSIFFKN